MDNYDKHWDTVANNLLLGKKIVKVRYFTEHECREMGWLYRPVALLLDSGIWVYPSSDDEGNEGGALFTTDGKEPVLPILR